MSVKYIITQEELDTLEAIRLSMYKHFITDDTITEVINVTNVSSPLWKIINKKRIPIKDNKDELLSLYERTINNMDDYFEYQFNSKVDKKFVISELDKLSTRIVNLFKKVQK